MKGEAVVGLVLRVNELLVRTSYDSKEGWEVSTVFSTRRLSERFIRVSP